MKTVTVVGCGAIGLFYGVMLKKAGLNVQFLLRSDYSIVKNQGVKIISSVFGEISETVQAFNKPGDLEKADLVIVGLKTTANNYLRDILPSVTDNESYVLTLQNGLGNEELIEEVISSDKIIGAVAFVCLNRIAPGIVEHSSFGHLKAGGYSSDFDLSVLNNISSLFAVSGIDCQISDNMNQLKWEKLIWNVPFNGLSAALGGTDTEKMLEFAPTKNLVENLMHEVIRAASTQGIDLSVDLVKANIDRTLKMGPYLTSMCLDYKNRQPVEVESIIGEPIRRTSGQIDLPFMESLYASLSFYNKNLSEF